MGLSGTIEAKTSERIMAEAALNDNIVLHVAVWSEWRQTASL